MELLDRYLQAVGRFLPVETKADTLAELRANLLETMDDRAEALGRPLTEAEASAMLKAHGKPEVVAMRYLPQRSLIGPTVFPFYVFTLKRAFPLVAMVYGIVRTAEMAAGHPMQDTAAWLVQMVLQFIPVSLVFWAVVTVVFAGIEAGARGREPGDWDPAKLPALDVAKAQSKTWRVADLIVHILLLAYVGAVPYHPFLILGPGAGYLDRVPAGLSPEWHLFYLGIVVLLVLQLVIKVIGLSSMPSRTLVPLDLVVKAMGIAIVGLMAGARVHLIPTAPSADLHTIAGLNATLAIGFKVVIVIMLVDLARGVWKYVRNSRAQMVLA